MSTRSYYDDYDKYDQSEDEDEGAVDDVVDTTAQNDTALVSTGDRHDQQVSSVATNPPTFQASSTLIHQTHQQHNLTYSPGNSRTVHIHSPP